MSDFFTELTDEELVEAQNAGRVRGAYDDVLKAFTDSGRKGVAVSNAAGPLAGKTLTSIKSGLDNAKKRLVANEATKTLGESVRVVHYKKDKNDEGQIRLYRTDNPEAAEAA
jgi:hypothetical protein